MSALSNHAENLLMTWLMTGDAASRPTAWYVALHTGDPGEAGSANEVSGNGYARQAASWTAPDAGASENAGAITFTAAGGDWGAIAHASIWTAASGGQCLWKGAATAKTIADGDSYRFAAGALTVSLD